VKKKDPLIEEFIKAAKRVDDGVSRMAKLYADLEGRDQVADESKSPASIRRWFLREAEQRLGMVAQTIPYALTVGGFEFDLALPMPARFGHGNGRVVTEKPVFFSYEDLRGLKSVQRIVGMAKAGDCSVDFHLSKSDDNSPSTELYLAFTARSLREYDRLNIAIDADQDFKRENLPARLPVKAGPRLYLMPKTGSLK
jgi:hypothetical protein